MLRCSKHFGNGDVQRGSQSIQCLNRGIFYAALNPPDVRAIHAGVYRQCLLRQGTFHAETSEIPSHESRCLHGPNKRLGGPQKHAL